MIGFIVPDLSDPIALTLMRFARWLTGCAIWVWPELMRK